MPSYTTPSDSTTTGLVGTLQYITSQVPEAIPALLFFIFLAITIIGYTTQTNRIGRGNLPVWLWIGSFITTTSAVVLYLIPGIIDSVTLGTCIAFTIIFSIWALFSEKD